MTPLILFTALFGWRELESLAHSRRWKPAWRGIALAAAGLLCLLPAPHGGREAFGKWTARTGPPSPLLDRVQQIEVRYLLGLSRRNRECAFISKTVRGAQFSGSKTEYDYVLFGGGRSTSAAVPHDGLSPAEAVRRHAAEASCAVFYESLDCNLKGSAGCEEETRDLEILDSRSLGTLTYSDPLEWGDLSPTIRLGLYRVPIGPEDADLAGGRKNR